MCLKTITQRLTPTNEITQAYKVFFTISDDRSSRNGLFGVYINGTDDLTVDTWMKAESRYLLAFDGIIKAAEHYPVGFHCFQSADEAVDNPWFTGFSEFRPQIRKVLLRGIHTIGTEGASDRRRSCTVIVANEMLITNEVIATNESVHKLSA